MFDDIKRVIRSRKSKDRQSNGQKKGDNQGWSLKANLGPALGLSTQVHTTTRCRFYREHLLWLTLQTTIYKTLNRKLNIEQHESHERPG